MPILTTAKKVSSKTQSERLMGLVCRFNPILWRTFCFKDGIVSYLMRFPSLNDFHTGIGSHAYIATSKKVSSKTQIERLFSVLVNPTQGCIFEDGQKLLVSSYV